MMMSDDIESIKKDFINVLMLRKNVTEVFEKISAKVESLKELYKEMITTETNNTADTQHSIFGIDAFLFQNKLIEMEYNNVVAMYKVIDNRIYYEHYKLYKMVQDYIKKEYSAFSKTQIQMQLLNKSFPVYKQLDTMKEYDISYTIEMQSIIIKTINDMKSYLEKREMELNENKKQIEKGIFIDNLINTQKYHNAIMKSNVDMFSQYLQTFNHHHTNYLTELLNTSLSILRNVNNNIRTNNVESAGANAVGASASEAGAGTGTNDVTQMEIIYKNKEDVENNDFKYCDNDATKK